jgi:hypothetical protein
MTEAKKPIDGEILEKIKIGVDALIISTVSDFFKKAGFVIEHEKIRKICVQSLLKNMEV